MGKSFDNDVMDGPPPDYCHSYALDQQAAAIRDMTKECHGRSVRAGWYNDPETGAPIARNLAEMMALEHSEISERLEAVRKNLPSGHLSGFSGEEEEAADSLIRLMDYCGHRGIDLGKVYVAKLLYNATREDHKLEARAASGGKKF
jgi:hypothetical protein